MTQQTDAVNKAIHFVEEQDEILLPLYVYGKRRNCCKIVIHINHCVTCRNCKIILYLCQMTWLHVSFREIRFQITTQTLAVLTKVFHKRKRKMFLLMTLKTAYSQIISLFDTRFSVKRSFLLSTQYISRERVLYGSQNSDYFPKQH